MATKRTAKRKTSRQAKRSPAKKSPAKKRSPAKKKSPQRPSAPVGGQFFAFGQDVRLAGARTALNSVPNSVIMGKIPDGPIPVRLDDPLRRGDSEPSGGASNVGDVISGAMSLYSPRLQNALTNFGLKIDFKPVQVFVPGRAEPLEGYAWARGVPSVEVESISFFTVDEASTNGQALFDASLNYSTVRVVNAALKAHLEAAGLEGVYFVPTEKYGEPLATILKMG